MTPSPRITRALHLSTITRRRWVDGSLRAFYPTGDDDDRGPAGENLFRFGQQSGAHDGRAHAAAEPFDRARWLERVHERTHGFGDDAPFGNRMTDDRDATTRSENVARKDERPMPALVIELVKH